MAIVDSIETGLTARGRGATIIQLRAPGLPIRTLQEVAARLVRESGLPVVVSRRADVALASLAAGVNLPEDDLPVAAARRLLGPAALLGRSVHDLPGARAAAAEGASFLLFGPVFATTSHPGHPGAGLAALREVARAASVPVLAIGGIDPFSAEACLGAGAAGYAAIGAFR